MRKKLQTLSGSQYSVQTVSLWFIHHKDEAQQCVAVWLAELKAGYKEEKKHDCPVSCEFKNLVLILFYM